jgi:hypothetical protein
MLLPSAPLLLVRVGIGLPTAPMSWGRSSKNEGGISSVNQWRGLGWGKVVVDEY